MRIVLYKSPSKYMVHDFKADELLDILDIVKQLGIKYYVIAY